MRRPRTARRQDVWILGGLFVLAGSAAGAGFGQPTEKNHASGDCSQCHNCDSPAPGHVCLKPCTRGEASRRAKEFQARLGPRVVILNQLENVYLPVPFDHAGHAEMAQMGRGCVTCHHYTPEGTEHPACRTCHEVASARADIRKPGLKGAYHRQCMSCHREWSGETGCEACHQSKTGASAQRRPAVPTADDLIGRMHPPIPEPKEEVYTTAHPDGTISKVLFRHREHTHDYHLRCAECHHEDNCSRCHEQGREHVQQQRTFEQHHRPCQECHRADKCEHCHFPEGSSAPPPFDHASTGWPLKPYHSSQSCRSCHSAVPFVRAERSCNACHAAWNVETFKHAVVGQTLDETHIRFDCVECHKDRDFSQRPACDGCHEAEEGVSFPEKRPGPATGKIGDSR